MKVSINIIFLRMKIIHLVFKMSHSYHLHIKVFSVTSSLELAETMCSSLSSGGSSAAAVNSKANKQPKCYCLCSVKRDGSLADFKLYAS